MDTEHRLALPGGKLRSGTARRALGQFATRLALLLQSLQFAGDALRARLYGLVMQEMGKHVTIGPLRSCASPRMISIGHHVQIGAHSYIMGQGGLKIGNYVMIAQNVSLISSNHAFSDLARPMMQQGYVSAPIIIDDDVWVGVNAVILPGVHLGQGAVVGANAVVSHDVPPYAVVGGVPARIISYRRTPVASDAENGADRSPGRP